MTDSGGVQKEAYLLKTPCITLRPETEWIETVRSGWNTLVGSNKEKIIEAVVNNGVPEKHPNFYGKGDTANKIFDIIKDNFDQT